jgi:hypothetical protein
MNNLSKNSVLSDAYQPKQDKPLNEPKIEVLSKEQAKNPPQPPPPPQKPKKKPGLISGKKAILAVVLLLFVVDIPIGLQLYKNMTANPGEKVTYDNRVAATPPTVPPPLPTAIPTKPAPTENQKEIAQALSETHAECFNGACLEVDGAGEDKCSQDLDCLAAPGADLSVATDSSELEATPTSSLSPTDIPVPQLPVAGNIGKTIIGALSGIGLLLLAILL